MRLLDGRGPETASPAGSDRQVTVGTYEWDLVSDVWLCSPELFAIHGLDPAATTPSTELLLGLTHDADRARMIEVVTEACRTGEPFSCLYRIVRPDGVLRTVLAVGKVDFTAANGAVAIQGYMVDLNQLPVFERVRELEVENQWLHDELAQTRNALAELHGKGRAGRPSTSSAASPGSPELVPVDDE